MAIPVRIPSPPPIHKKCSHQNCYESTIVDTVIYKYRPISGSRVAAINNFTIDKKRNIEKKVYKCNDCGATLKEKPIQEFFTGSTMQYAKVNNIPIGQKTKSVGNNNIAIGVNSFGIPPSTNKDSLDLILDKNEIEYLLNTKIMGEFNKSYFNKEEVQRNLREIKEMLENHKKETYRGYSESRRALDDARKQVQELKVMRDKIVAGHIKEKKNFGGRFGYKYDEIIKRNEEASNSIKEILEKQNDKKKEKESTIYDYLNLMFKFPFIDIKTVDDKEFYDITFSPSVKMTNDKLGMFENGGQVVEWEKVSKGLFKGSERRIKIMRIEKAILDEWFKNKFSKEKKDEDKLG